MPDNLTAHVPAERLHFKALLLANPNHFGTLQSSKFPAVADIQGNTEYESIGCVGYNPEQRRLEATVQLKLSGGYLGGLCAPGSQEYVRFFVSFDGGASWTGAGMASFTAHDINRAQPTAHAVGVAYDAGSLLCLASKQTIRVRAILSWNNPPPDGQPGFVPVWGNIVEVTARRHPVNIVKLPFGVHVPSLIIEAKISPATLFAAMTTTAEPSLGTLIATYAAKGVPQHRALYPQLAMMLAQPPAAGAAFASELANLVPDANFAELSKLILLQQGNTTFERLDCVGYDAADQMLAAVLTLRLANGYSGGPCTAGSLEHVAFFIDWHDGSGFHFAGATAARVHDQADLPADGIHYDVRAPLSVEQHQRLCSQGPVLAHVRAILSWSTPVPPGDPNYVPVWGNRQEVEIQIEPGQPVGTGVVPILSAVGDILIGLIDSAGLIQNGAAINHPGNVFDDAPFGGRITLAGKIANGTGATRYRIMRRLAGSGDFVPLTNEPAGLTLPLTTYDPVSGVKTQDLVVHADSDGYYLYQDYNSFHYVENTLLGEWFSNLGEDGKTFEVRFDVATDGIPAHDLHSDVVFVKVDNQEPVAKLTVDNGADGECADYDLGTAVTGTFVATDANIGSYSFTILPPKPANSAIAIPLAAPFDPSAPLPVKLFQQYPLLPDPGITAGFYEIATSLMKPCGYSLTLEVWDRTNVDSGQGTHHSSASIGFCVRLPAES